MRLRTQQRKYRLAIEWLEERCCPTTVTTLTTIPIPGVRVGDMVSIDAILNTTDPNENGEGEALIINTSNGTFTISAYAQPRNLTIQARADGESISAFIQGFDGDESADVNVSLTTLPPRKTQTQKDAYANLADDLSYWALFWTTVAGETAVECPPCALWATRLAVADGALAVYYNKLARDPLDPNFTVIAQPNPPSLPPITAQPPLTFSENNAFSALITNLELQIGLTQAIDTSINRANGAFVAGNSFWEQAQLQAANQYLGQLKGALNAEPGLLSNLQNAIQTGGFPKVTITTAAALNFESNIASQGLPPSMVQVSTELGLDSATIVSIRQLMIVQNINLVAGSIPAKITDPPLIRALQTLAQVLILNPLSATGINVSATAGAPFTGVVATFTDASGSHPVSNYSATITWGDGNTSGGTITPNGSGGFNVSGTNTYAAAGSYSISVKITDAASDMATATSTAAVSSLGLGIEHGQSAGIGFWQNNNGQALIKSFNGGATATALANWLATNFPNIYGASAGASNLTGKTNAQVAAFYLTLFGMQGPKLDAQVLATALNVYATTLSLGGTAGQAYGFMVTATGLGARSYNVGSSGAAFGVPNNTTLNVYQILRAANQKAVRGVLYNGDKTLRDQAIMLFDGINKAGGIG